MGTGWSSAPEPLQRSTALRDWVRAEIRSRIADGRLRPGERILEREVAEALVVSRVPVREAIRLLEADGYLQVVGARGVAVRELTPTEVDQMFDVRGALEVLAARLAARRATGAEIRTLRELLDESRQAIDNGAETDAVGQLNRLFHHTVRQFARNPFIDEREEPLIGRLHWAFQRSPEPERVWAAHHRLVDALANRDEELAASVAAEDNEHNRQVALARLPAAPVAREP